jgi:hypothetical protein
MSGVLESGAPLPPERIPLWNDCFRQPNRTQSQWLRYFFENGNALCHPSVLIRRAFYENHGLYDNRLRQLPDFERWITLVKHYSIIVLGDEDLVRFRVLTSEQNASSATRANVVRGLHEHIAINEMIFDGCSDELIVEAFADLLRNPHINNDDERECELAFLWWDTACGMRGINRVHGQRRLRTLLNRTDTARLLLTRYGFNDLSLHDYAAHEKSELTPPLADWLTSLEGMTALPEPEVPRDPIAEAPAGQLLRVVLSRARGARLSRWPQRTLHHLWQAVGPA